MAIGALFGLAIVVLRLEGRRWWCRCGRWTPWTGDIWSAHNSQHLFDPYSFTHVEHGLILYALLRPLARWLGPNRRLLLALAVETLWEIIENTPMVINNYRKAALARGYEGDSVVNSLGDIAACGLGLLLAHRLPARWSIALFIGMELVLAGRVSRQPLTQHHHATRPDQGGRSVADGAMIVHRVPAIARSNPLHPDQPIGSVRPTPWHPGILTRPRLGVVDGLHAGTCRYEATTTRGGRSMIARLFLIGMVGSLGISMPEGFDWGMVFSSPRSVTTTSTGRRESVAFEPIAVVEDPNNRIADDLNGHSKGLELPVAPIPEVATRPRNAFDPVPAGDSIEAKLMVEFCRIVEAAEARAPSPDATDPSNRLDRVRAGY